MDTRPDTQTTTARLGIDADTLSCPTVAWVTQVLDFSSELVEGAMKSAFHDMMPYLTAAPSQTRVGASTATHAGLQQLLTHMIG